VASYSSKGGGGAAAADGLVAASGGDAADLRVAFPPGGPGRVFGGTAHAPSKLLLWPAAAAEAGLWDENAAKPFW
jgi:hypothetical protein